jgi:outer membrane protein
MRAALLTTIITAATATSGAAQPPSAATILTLKDAEHRALENHPQIRAGQYAALAATENIREAKSAYFPMAFGSFTGAGAMDGTRIAAGGLNNPTILDRFAGGIGVSQLITDFGRTNRLVQSSVLVADSREKEVDVRRADVLLQVDRAVELDRGADPGAAEQDARGNRTGERPVRVSDPDVRASVPDWRIAIGRHAFRLAAQRPDDSLNCNHL